MNQISKISKIKNFLAAAILASSCTLSGTLYDDYNGAGQQGQPAEPSTMTLTLTKAGAVTLGISGTGSININWGDGSAVQTNNILPSGTNFSRSGSGTRTVTISGFNITRLDCSDNQVTHINVGEIITLTHLFCGNNELTALNVNSNTRLVMLLCNNNRLTALNVGANTALSVLNSGFNNMQPTALNTLLTSLHGNTITGGKTVLINDNNGTASSQSINTATNRGWEVIE